MLSRSLCWVNPPCCDLGGCPRGGDSWAGCQALLPAGTGAVLGEAGGLCGVRVPGWVLCYELPVPCWAACRGRGLMSPSLFCLLWGSPGEGGALRCPSVLPSAWCRRAGRDVMLLLARSHSRCAALCRAGRGSWAGGTLPPRSLWAGHRLLPVSAALAARKGGARGGCRARCPALPRAWQLPQSRVTAAPTSREGGG